MTTKYGNEDYTPATYEVTTRPASKGKFLGVVADTKTKVILHGCRHGHDTKRQATDCIRELMRVNNWRINIVN
jgi:hypothetical protein